MKRLKGQSMLEFALVFPLIFLLITGMIDLGRAVFYYSTLNNAVREGTRFAVVQPKGNNDSAIKAKIRSYFYNVKDLNDNAQITISSTGTASDPKIQIQITYQYSPITPGLKQILGAGSGITIHAQSEMRLTPIAQ